MEGEITKPMGKKKTIEMTDEGMTNAEILLDVKDCGTRSIRGENMSF